MRDSSKGKRMPRPITTLFLGTFLTYSFCFLFTMLRPTYYLSGDQVYYLIMAASLWDDGDLELTDEYADEIYRTFYPQPLTEQDIRGHNLVSQGGGLYSRHGAGLPLLILPGWAIGRQVGVNLWLIVLAALLATQLFALMNELIPQRNAIWLAWVSVVVSPPLILYAPLLFTELPAALALVLALRFGLLRPASNRQSTCLALSGLLFLPWLNPRYILLVLPLAAILWHRRRRWLALIAATGTALPFLHFWFLLGYAPTLGDYGWLALDIFPAGALGLWLDREAGLLPYAPIYLLALYGMIQTGRTRNPIWRFWNWLWLPYYLFISAYSAWFGGWNPPARMLTPLLPFMVPLVALALREMVPRIRAVTVVLLTSASATSTVLLLTHPLLQYNREIGQSSLFEFLHATTGINLNELWPSFIFPSPLSYRQATLIIIGIAAAYGLIFTHRAHRARE